MRHALSMAIIAMALFQASPASACPLCDSGTGVRVRAGIFESAFGYNLFATLLPFPVLAGIIALIRFGPRIANDRSPAGVRTGVDPDSESHQDTRGWP